MGKEMGAWWSRKITTLTSPTFRLAAGYAAKTKQGVRYRPDWAPAPKLKSTIPTDGEKTQWALETSLDIEFSEEVLAPRPIAAPRIETVDRITVWRKGP